MCSAAVPITHCACSRNNSYMLIWNFRKIARCCQSCESKNPVLRSMKDKWVKLARLLCSRGPNLKRRMTTLMQHLEITFIRKYLLLESFPSHVLRQMGTQNLLWGSRKMFLTISRPVLLYKWMAYIVYWSPGLSPAWVSVEKGLDLPNNSTSVEIPLKNQIL